MRRNKTRQIGLNTIFPGGIISRTELSAAPESTKYRSRITYNKDTASHIVLMTTPNILEVGRRVIFSECKQGAVLYLNQADQFLSSDIEFTGLRNHAFGHPCLVRGQMFHEHVEICPLLANLPAEEVVLQPHTTNVSQMTSSNDTDKNSPTLHKQVDQSSCEQFYIPMKPKSYTSNANIGPLKWKGNGLPALCCGGYVDISNWGIVPHKMLSIIDSHGGLSICRLDFKSVDAVRAAFDLQPLTQESYSSENVINNMNGMNGVHWGRML